jgi:anti-sigma B factor antagonist
VAFSSTVSDQRAVVTASGELDLSTAPELRQFLRQTVADGARELIVDLSDVGFLDSTTLGVLIGARNRMLETGGTISIICPNRSVLRIFQLAGLDQVFTIHQSLADATRDGH